MLLERISTTSIVFPAQAVKEQNMQFGISLFGQTNWTNMHSTTDRP
jgi:alpha-L-fucosidase